MRKPRLPVPQPSEPSRGAIAPPPAPWPHRNLGQHLKAPKDGGEYVTEHHRGAKKPKA